MNIYVGRLARSVTEQMLRELFESKGAVTSVKIMKDKFTGDPRGFGFVEMVNNDEAQQAIVELNGYELERQALVVNEARKPEDRPARRPYGGGGGGRSFGGGGSDYGNRDRNGTGGRKDSWNRKPRF